MTTDSLLILLIALAAGGWVWQSVFGGDRD